MIRISISPKQRRILDAEMKAFATRAGVAVGEVVAIVGQSCAKELARKVQPWGLNQAGGKKFMLSIAKQVHNAARYAEQTAIQGDIETVHKGLRNHRGAVVKRPSKQFQPKRKLFDRTELKAYVEKQMAKAGMAKAGWVAAGESISSPLLKTARGLVRKIKGIAPWIRRHAKSSAGSSVFKNNGRMSSTIFLTNNSSYAYSKNNTNRGDVSTALSDGYKRSITMIRARLKKLK
jgi:hypothetical protein